MPEEGGLTHSVESLYCGVGCIEIVRRGNYILLSFAERSFTAR